MLRDYALITIEDINAHVATYIGTSHRTEQSSRQLHTMLQGSLGSSLKTRLLARKSEYTYTNPQLVTVEDGVAMLKLVLTLINVDTRASVSMLDERLECEALAVKFRETEFNVVEFNLYVADTIDQLLVRGQPNPSLVSKLLKVYKEVPDGSFLDEMKFN
jgi:hypothetical protein